MVTHLVSQSGFGAAEYTPEEVRSAIASAQAVMATMEQVEVPVTHHFSDGIYGREIFLRRGTLFTGRIHKQNDLSVCLSGICEILTPDGWKRCEAGDITISRKGVKPIARAVEDTRWLTNHATTLTDLDEIEAALFEDEGFLPLDFKTGKPIQNTLIDGGVQCQA